VIALIGVTPTVDVDVVLAGPLGISATMSPRMA